MKVEKLVELKNRIDKFLLSHNEVYVWDMEYDNLMKCYIVKDDRIRMDYVVIRVKWKLENLYREEGGFTNNIEALRQFSEFAQNLLDDEIYFNL